MTGIGLLAVGTVGFQQLIAFIAAGLSIYLAGLSLALGYTELCSAFMGGLCGAKCWHSCA
jgi:hypothetical protein